MARNIIVLFLCCIIAVMPGVCVAAEQGLQGSASWSTIVQEENSLVASVLLLPYLVLQVPIRMIDGILYPKPTSQSTVPPAAHRSPR